MGNDPKPAPLPSRPLGRTGLSVTRLGLGLAALGRPGYINLGHADDLAYNYTVEAMERRAHRLLQSAYEHGVRYFDAARSYGRAESFLQSWLEQTRPDGVTVASKWGYTYTADWKVETDVHEVKDHSLDTLQRQWERSRALLPYLRIYQIHSATLDTGVLEDHEVLHALQALKTEGVAVGLSVSGPRQGEVLRRALDVRLDGEALFDTVQVTFNLLERSTAPVLAEAAQRGVGVIVKEALANGRLTARNRAPEQAEALDALKGIAFRFRVGVDAVALAYVLAQPWADVVLSGAAVENHLLSNLQAAQLRLSPEDRQRLDAFSSPPEAYWAERAQLSWN